MKVSHDRRRILDPRSRRALAARRSGACSLLLGCDNDKEVDPPAELVDIIATRDCASASGAPASAATPRRLRLALRRSSSKVRVYAASHDGEVIALAADTGQARAGRSRPSCRCPPDPKSAAAWSCWVRATATWSRSMRPTAPSAGASRSASEILARPLVANDIVVIRTVDGHVEGLAVADGKTALGCRRAGAAAHVARHGAAGARGRSHHRRVRQRQSARDRSAQRRSAVGHDRQRAARPHRARAPRRYRFAGARLG